MNARETLLKYSRSSITPEFARTLCKAFNVEFSQALVHTKNQYREESDGTPRVSVYQLTEHIAVKLNRSPDEELLVLAGKFFGAGRYVDTVTEAWAKNLPDGEEVKA
jgi:hypothetical protein